MAATLQNCARGLLPRTLICMNISSFDELLLAARQQAEPQRLLMVFVGASLGEEASQAERAAFEQGAGGEITPLMCVDKCVTELSDFASLAGEADTMAQAWVLVFAGAIAAAAEAREVDTALRKLVESVRVGQVQSLAVFNREGQAVMLR